ncbi:MAG: hypothetical protein ABUK01_19145 [Leptospirales bacterium]
MNNISIRKTGILLLTLTIGLVTICRLPSHIEKKISIDEKTFEEEFFFSKQPKISFETIHLNNKQSALLITEIKENSFLFKNGVRVNDMIIEICNIPYEIENIDILVCFTKPSPGKIVNFKIQRNQQVIDYIITFN